MVNNARNIRYTEDIKNADAIKGELLTAADFYRQTLKHNNNTTLLLYQELAVWHYKWWSKIALNTIV
jgi:hypothetical protein